MTRIPFFKIAEYTREHNRRRKAKKLAYLRDMATKERSMDAAATQPEAAKPQQEATPRVRKEPPQSKPEGSKYVGIGLSRRLSWVRMNSEFRGNPYRRWRLQWRGNLFGGRRKLSTGVFTKFWGKYSEVGYPSLLLEAL